MEPLCALNGRFLPAVVGMPKATLKDIIAAAREAYAAGDRPNTKLAYRRTRDVLNAKRLDATKASIEGTLAKPEFAAQRDKPGGDWRRRS